MGFGVMQLRRWGQTLAQRAEGFEAGGRSDLLSADVTTTGLTLGHDVSDHPPLGTDHLKNRRIEARRNGRVVGIRDEQKSHCIAFDCCMHTFDFEGLGKAIEAAQLIPIGYAHCRARATSIVVSVVCVFCDSSEQYASIRQGRRVGEA